MEHPNTIQLIPVSGLPEIRPRDDLAGALWSAIQSGPGLCDGDIVAVAHKVVSKAEGRVIDLATVTPSPEALRLGEEVEKDPRKVEVILRESRRVIRTMKKLPGRETGVLICEHRLGFISANAAVDESNVPGRDCVVALPENPDASAEKLREHLSRSSGRKIGVVITDTFGRPWRVGLVDVAVGIAGIPALVDLRGTRDACGRELKASMPALADQVAASAGMVMTKADGLPVVIVRGLQWSPQSASSVRELLRPAGEDLFL